MPQFFATTDPDFEDRFTALLGAKREDSPEVDHIVADIIVIGARDRNVQARQIDAAQMPLCDVPRKEEITITIGRTTTGNIALPPTRAYGITIAGLVVASGDIVG